MSYTRKTFDEFEVQGLYELGWECVTSAETMKEARGYLKDYRENDPAVSFRIRKYRRYPGVGPKANGSMV